LRAGHVVPDLAKRPANARPGDRGHDPDQLRPAATIPTAAVRRRHCAAHSFRTSCPGCVPRRCPVHQARWGSHRVIDYLDRGISRAAEELVRISHRAAVGPCKCIEVATSVATRQKTVCDRFMPIPMRNPGQGPGIRAAGRGEEAIRGRRTVSSICPYALITP
jgi:hypothetical protein